MLGIYTTFQILAWQAISHLLITIPLVQSQEYTQYKTSLQRGGRTLQDTDATTWSQAWSAS